MVAGHRLLRLEEKDGAVSEVEVDEVFGFMGHEASKVPPDDAMPCGTLALVECPLDVLRDVLLDRELRHRLLSDVDSLLLHVLRHVSALDLGIELLPRARGSSASFDCHGCCRVTWSS